MKGSHAEALRRKDQKQELPGLLCDFGDFASLRETVSALSPKYLANSRELRVWRFVNLSVLATLQWHSPCISYKSGAGANPLICFERGQQKWALQQLPRVRGA